MGKKRKKIKKKCCGKYLKSGKHCKDCPLVKRAPVDKKEKKAATKKDKEEQKKGNRKKN